MPRRLLFLYAVAILAVTTALGGLIVGFEPLSRLMALAVTVTFVTLGISVIAVRSLHRGVRDVSAAARKIMAGQYGHEIRPPDDGDVGLLARTFNDMSARLADEFARVEQDRQQLRAILGGMIEGVVAIDAQQRLLFANERGGELLEFNMRTAAGLRLWEVVRQRNMISIVEKALEKGEPQQQEFDWKGKPGKTLLIHVSPLRDKPGGAILVVHDTSELRRLERLRQEFVANVSHELKTPLAVIKASVETLENGAVDDADHRGTFLAQIHEQAERLNTLILDLLSLARIESGGMRLEYNQVVIADAVQDCFERHRGRADVRGQILEMLPPEEPSATEIRTDEEALGHILDNLIDNALKYTQEGSRIRVRWYGQGEFICIEVEDDGPGIPAEDLPRIFERFYRVDKARSRELGGTGLGLAIVKNLAHAMRGTASVTSDAGKGAIFKICLPRTEH